MKIFFLDSLFNKIIIENDINYNLILHHIENIVLNMYMLLKY